MFSYAIAIISMLFTIVSFIPQSVLLSFLHHRCNHLLYSSAASTILLFYSIFALPVMLLRNINQQGGLNNRLRLILTRIGRYNLEGQLLGGDHDGELKIIPRMPLTSVEGELPFILTERQFPVRLCFAMTVNKLPAQSLNTVGLDIHLPVFCHGQLYVALSRVINVFRMTVLLSEQSGDKTENIVYPKVLEAVQAMADRE